jgi:ProP effector
MAAAEILELLYAQFPAAFARDPADRQPLKCGIHRDLMARLEGAVSRKGLSRAIGAYVSDPGYRGKLVENAVRVDLDGNPAGAVTAREVEQAQRKLARPAPSPAPDPAAKGLSLADLRAAARRRKALAGG